MAVLAGAALSVELIGRVEGAKDFGVAVNIDQRTGADIPAAQRKKSRGIDVAEIGDEDDPVAVANLEAFVDRSCFHIVRGHST